MANNSRFVIAQVNLNNIQNVGMEVFEELASAMECNTHVRHLLLANVGLTDRPARALASMLRKNMTLQMLNVESNFITGNHDVYDVYVCFKIKNGQ